MNQEFFKEFDIFGKEIKDNKIKNLSCEDCGLYKKCNSPKMKLTGKGRLKILIVSEFPGKTEDERGIQLIGETGQKVRDYIEDIGLDLDDDFWKIHAVNCRPVNNKIPTNLQIKCCRKFVLEAIEKYKPKGIILMGKIALESVLGERLLGRIKGVSFSDWVGEIIPDQELNSYILVVNNPAYIFTYNQYDNILKKEWLDSFKKLIEVSKQSFYKHNYQNDYFITEDKEEAIKWIKEIKEKNDIISFDYETTGIKPHKKGHRIVTVSISDGQFGYAFPFFNDEDFRKEWNQLLKFEKINLIAHNARFEGMWTKVILGYNINNWLWDTMIGQSILDNRKNLKLKFWVYIKLGILSYDEHIDKYISKLKEGEDEKSTNSFNCIDEAPIKDLLKYNALDSLFTFKLYEEQRQEIKGFLKKGFRFFMEGFQNLLKVQLNGVRINEKYLKDQDNRLIIKLKNIKEKIYRSEELKKWDKEEFFNFNSSKQLSYLLYNLLGVKEINKTKKGALSVDQPTLEKIDLPIIKNILRYRKWYKLKNTYFSQYERENINGYIHPFFNLGNVKTYRSCIAKGTKILVVKDFIKHPNGIPIEEIKQGDYVYCFDDNLKLKIKKVLWAGKTGNKKIIRVYFKGARGKKGFLDVTPEHKIRLINGDYVQAKELIKDYRGILNDKNKYTPKCRVLSVHRHKDKLFITNCKEEKEHRKIYEFFSGRILNHKDIIHHKDKNHLNHIFSNLQKINKKEHSRLHYIDYLGTKKSREKNIQIIKEKHKRGEYKYKKGIDVYNYINLSKFDCLRLLFKSKGRIKYIEYDFDTFKKYCKIHNIDLKIVRLHYNKDNEFIHKNNVIKYLKKYGYDKTYKKLKIGYYKLKRLLEYWNICYEKGKIINNNHLIYKIEYLDKKVDVYDLEIEDYNNFIANEICVHNSSNSPNLQNVIKRDESMKKILRNLIIPRENNRLVEYDFKGMEVCFEENTLVETIDGSRTIKDIVNNYDKEDIYVYCYNSDKKRIGVSKVINGFLTAKNKDTIKIILDNNKEIIVTENHEFMLRDGSYKKAKDLTIKDSLMPFYTYIHKTNYKCNYLYIKLNNGSKMFAHNLIAEDVFGIKIRGTDNIVHHKNSNGLCNSLYNLEVMKRKQHMKIHSIQGWNKYKKTGKRNFKKQRLKEQIEKRKKAQKEWWNSLCEEEKKILVERAKKTRGSQKGKNNPMYGKKHSEESKRKISKTKKEQDLTKEKSYWYGKKHTEELKKRWSFSHRREILSEETLEKMRKAQKGKIISEEARKKISEKMKGRIFSEETRKKISEKKKEYWAKKKKQEEQEPDYNHKIKSIEKYSKKDVYCLTVHKHHNFVLSAGVVVKNCISACYNQDPTLIKYLKDDSTDMHRDWAASIFLCDIKDVSKYERYVAKNKFVFPEFYGSYYVDIAPNIWNDIKEETKEKLKMSGIYRYEKFEKHIRDVEDYFWNEKFPVYAEWKKETIKQYEKDGYVELFTGFRCLGPLRRNEIINYKIQGCLNGKSKIQTDKGWVEIKKLVNKKINVWNGFKWCEAIGLNRGKSKLAYVYLDSGLTVSCDIRHKFKNEKNKWIDFDDLKIGDRVALPRIRDRVYWDKEIDWFFILGFIIGDGCFYKRKSESNKEGYRYILTICGGEKKKNIILNIKNFLEKNKYKTRISIKKPTENRIENRYVLCCEGKKIKEKLELFGLKVGENAHNKKIPFIIWGSNKQNQANFMEGLWLSDGARNRGANRFLHMCNKKLLKEVQLLCYGIGYDSYLSKTNTGWVLRFRNLLLRNNKDSRKYPKECLYEAINGKTIKYDGTNETITDIRNIKSNKDIGQNIAQRIIDKYNKKFFIYRYDKVIDIKITDIEEDTYTMSVDDDLHQFIADGVVCKNTAFHCLLWTFNNVMRESEKFNKSFLIGQIHDSMLGDINPEDENEFDYLVWKYGTQEIVKKWDWIIVPLKIEKERSEINGSWAEMTDCGYLDFFNKKESF